MKTLKELLAIIFGKKVEDKDELILFGYPVKINTGSLGGKLGYYARNKCSGKGYTNTDRHEDDKHHRNRHLNKYDKQKYLGPLVGILIESTNLEAK